MWKLANAALIVTVVLSPCSAQVREKHEKKSPAADSCSRTEMQGKIFRGQSFEKEFAGKYLFQLVENRDPAMPGWTAQITSVLNPKEDFSMVVTPPYRGLNARHIEGWHFRNADNMGPNLGDVNAPQLEREFSFVLNREDFAKSFAALEIVLWSYGHSEEEIKGAEKTLHEVRMGKAKLVIRDLKLGNLVKGQRAWIESMKFRAEICIPRASASTPK